VEIFGGGYVRGDKVAAGKGQGEGSPAGLIKRSNDSIVYVALNYRLGAFGWLAGPDFESQGGKSNAGLLDQRMALEWVQKYIHLFGGDPEQVTVLGESAGGGSLEHQITVSAFTLFESGLTTCLHV
jgi:carboxylesterase type B